MGRQDLETVFAQLVQCVLKKASMQVCDSGSWGCSAGFTEQGFCQDVDDGLMRAPLGVASLPIAVCVCVFSQPTGVPLFGACGR